MSDEEGEEKADNLRVFPGTVMDTLSYFTPEKLQEVEAAVVIWEEDGQWFISCSRMDVKELNYTARLLSRMVDQVIDSTV